MSVSWNYFNKFDPIEDEYLPASGQGNTMATQIVTAVCKLVYKWYNDGDVFDNTRYLSGWANDLSSYANWLWKNTDASDILTDVFSARNDGEYEDILKEVADMLMNEEYLKDFKDKDVVGSIYDCDGPFKFEEYSEDDEYDEDEY